MKCYLEQLVATLLHKTLGDELLWETEEFPQGFQTTLTLSCFGGAQFVGEVAPTEAEAVRVAAQQALAVLEEPIKFFLAYMQEPGNGAPALTDEQQLGDFSKLNSGCSGGPMDALPIRGYLAGDKMLRYELVEKIVILISKVLTESGLPQVGVHECKGEKLADTDNWVTAGAVTPVKGAFSSIGGLEGSWVVSAGHLQSVSPGPLSPGPDPPSMPAITGGYDAKSSLEQLVAASLHKALGDELLWETDEIVETEEFPQGGFQNTLTLSCFGGTQFVGEVAPTKAEAVRAAAQQALAVLEEPLQFILASSGSRGPHHEQLLGQALNIVFPTTSPTVVADGVSYAGVEGWPALPPWPLGSLDRS